MTKTKKKQYYVVVNGRHPGIYTQWFGVDGAQEQIEGFDDAIYKGFITQTEALEWLGSFSEETLMQYAPDLLDLILAAPAATAQADPSGSVEDCLREGKVVINTDGAAIGNPGPGGFGVVLRFKEHHRELSGGYRLTTNNRMELMACIKGLTALHKRCQVVLFSDSRYVVDSITKGSAQRWKSAGWKRDRKHVAENSDLWGELLNLCDQHDVEFRWVPGHAGNPDNERCDALAVAAAQGTDLAPDEGYEARGARAAERQDLDGSHLPGMSELNR